MLLAQVAQRMSYSPATDISAPERRYGVLLLREEGAVLEAFVAKDHGLIASDHSLYVETDREAACRYGHLPRPASVRPQSLLDKNSFNSAPEAA